MSPKKIKTFLGTLEDYFKKKSEIVQAMAELDMLLHKANDDLNYTIDNGLSNEHLVKVVKAYDKHKFNSKIVSEFIDKIYEMFFKDLEVEFKDRLEVVSMRINNNSYFTSFSDHYETILGSISIDIHDNLANRFFKLLIPIKNSISTDMVHWFKNGEGMYQVIANAVDANRSKTICKVFDQSKVCDVVRKYLNGEFDEELSCNSFDISHYLNKNKACSYYSVMNFAEFAYGNCTYYTDNGLKFVELHDLFNTKEAMHDDNDAVGCVCDIDEYSAKKESTI